MKAQTRLPRLGHRTFTSITTGGESKIQNGQDNILGRFRGSVAFEPRQVPGIGKKADRGLKRSRRKLLLIELILQCFRHKELSDESGTDDVAEWLVNVRRGIGRHRNPSQRDHSVGHNRKGENAK